MTGHEARHWQPRTISDSTLPGLDGDHWFATALRSSPEQESEPITIPLTPTLPLAAGPVTLTIAGSAALKDDAGAVKVETVIEEIAKLKQIRALNLPIDLFYTVPSRFVTQYRQRAAGEKPREIRRHPPAVRATARAPV